MISFCATPMVAAKSAVNAPIKDTKVIAPLTPWPVAEKTGDMRTMRYTPAETMVAAWMRAETGVGPSMASGNHTCSGNWADLPIAPQKMRIEISTAHGTAPKMGNVTVA